MGAVPDGSSDNQRGDSQIYECQVLEFFPQTMNNNEFPSLVITVVTYSAYEKDPIKFTVPNSIYGFGAERTQSTDEALEIVFRQLNHVDGKELISEPQYKGLRSMSVGDTVRFSGPSGWVKTFVCEGSGWKETAS